MLEFTYQASVIGQFCKMRVELRSGYKVDQKREKFGNSY